MKKIIIKAMLAPCIISIILIFSFIYFGFNSNFININLMGNSVSKIYYYCDDITYKLNNNKCIKTEYIASLLIGDTDLDNEITIKDITKIQQYLANYIELDDNQLLVSDVNNDSTINSLDISLLQRYLLEYSNNQNSKKDSKDIPYNLGVDKVCPKNYQISSDKTKCSITKTKDATKIEILYGDLNYDKIVDSSDTRILSNYLEGKIKLDDIQKISADVNYDGIININDLNQINSRIIKEESSISAKVSLISNVDIKSISKNTNVTYKVDFNIKGTNNYYYKWFDIKSTNNVISSECKSAKSSDSYNVNITDNNEYILLKVYNDSSCLNEINMYKTDEVKIKEESSISLDVKLVSPILTSNIVNKDTVLNFQVKPSIKGSDKYYYTFTSYGDNKAVNTTVCYSVKDTINSKIVVNKKDVYGVWRVYNNSNCSQDSLVKAYETDRYNYLVESISLNLINNKLLLGSSTKIDANINSSIKTNNQDIKWSSTNENIATVNNNGVVIAKKEGKCNITASIGSITATKEIIVVDNNNDIKCPALEYKEVGNRVDFTVKPDASITKYEIYLSSNNSAGSNANFKYITTDTGVKTFNNIYDNNKYSNQAKIVVFTKDGSSKNCYSSVFITTKNANSIYAKCPSITYSFDKIGNLYNYQMNGNRVNSGSSKMYVNFKLDSDYQYSFLTSNKNGSYKIVNTYGTSDANVIIGIPAYNYNSNGMIIVTDKYGDSVVCKTEYVNNIKYYKTHVGTTDIYYETSFPLADRNTVINQMTLLNNKSNAYLAATNVFLNSENTFVNIYGQICGLYSSISNSIIIRESKNVCGSYANSDYFKGVIKHEFGHSIDRMNYLLTSVSLSDSTYNGLKIDNYKSKYQNTKLCNYNYCLGHDGKYIYTSGGEFFADLFSYDVHNYRVNNELLNLRNQILKSYLNNYSNYSKKFRNMKESFR